METARTNGAKKSQRAKDFHNSPLNNLVRCNQYRRRFSIKYSRNLRLRLQVASINTRKGCVCVVVFEISYLYCVLYLYQCAALRLVAESQLNMF